MGQEIDHTVFSQEGRDQFKHNLATETQALETCFSKSQVDDDTYVAGFELEACLVDKASLRPAPVNGKFLEQLDSELASAELASFNTEPLPFRDSALRDFHQQPRVPSQKPCLSRTSWIASCFLRHFAHAKGRRS